MFSRFVTFATYSVNISIQLSIESNLMKSDPDALTLLSIIALFPAGGNVSLLPKLAPSISNLVRAKKALLAATLTHFVDNQRTLQLLSPVRSYVLKNIPPTDDIRHTVHEAYIQFFRQHDLNVNNPNYRTTIETLSTHETNLEAIFREAVQDGSRSTIEAAISFSWYQCWTRPRMEVIKSTIKVCTDHRKGVVLARSLQCLGNLTHKIAPV